MRETIERLRDYILSVNPYFTEGITEVFLDETQGLVNNGYPVFPDDTKTNYFYLRLPDSFPFVQSPEYVISDCITGLGMTAPITLVAVMKDVNEEALLLNLINTIQTFPVQNKTIISGNYRKEAVTKQELSFMNKENLQSALQRIPDNVSIVSLSFSISIPIIVNYCITNPCTQC